MSNHIADATKMVSDTPRTDAGLEYDDTTVDDVKDFACQLERELNAANERIKRLEEFVDQLTNPKFTRDDLPKEALLQRIKRLEDGILKQNQEIEQTCGKVLGYPWFKDDQKNFPGATEKDGVCVGDHVAETIVSELASRYTEALARIKRLEDAGDALKAAGYFGGWADAVDKWIKVKEAKP